MNNYSNIDILLSSFGGIPPFKNLRGELNSNASDNMFLD
jgi:hypothetical protein